MDICPKCQCQMFIDRANTYAINDDTPNKPTEVLHKAYVYCANSQCAAYKIKIADAPTEIPLVEETTDYTCDCGAVLMSITKSGKVEIPKQIKSYAVSPEGDYKITCPLCGKEKDLKILGG